MSRYALGGLVVLAFFGVGLVGFAQVPGTRSAFPTLTEPGRLPDNFVAKPLSAKGQSGPQLNSAANGSSRASLSDLPAEPPVTEIHSPAAGMKITEFGRIANEYATVAAEEGAPAAAPGNKHKVPSIPLGTRRRPSQFEVPADPSAAPMTAPAVPGNSVLKKPEPAAIPAPVTPLEEAPATPLEEAPAAIEAPMPMAEIDSGDRMSARRSTKAVPTYNEASSVPTSIRDMSYRSVAPRLRLETRGPAALNVNKESRFYVDLFNEGETDAPEVQVRLVLPASVTVQQVGEGATIHNDSAGQRVMWTVPKIDARDRTTLELRVIATEAKAFEMSVDWAFRPAGFKASIAVRQPQLQVAVTGPGEMAFGEEKSFRVTVSNVGSGDAENIVVQTGATGNRDQKLDVGTLSSGAQKEFTVTFIANQTGEMEIKALAIGEQELTAESASKVLIRRAELVAAMTGPPLKYAGSEATYAIAVGNNGNTPANDVQMSLVLPAGAKFIGGIDGSITAGNVVKWRAGQIAAGSERLFEAVVQLNTAGENRVEVQARGTGPGVAAATQAATNVEALADLKLVVNDPAGPFPAGGEVTYELQVLNRGSNVANNVTVVMHFSEGIEPTGVEGIQAKLVPGQVLCEALPKLNAGEKISLKVKAKGEKEGNHLFRVEALCAEPETKLVSEGTTRFIPDSGTARVGTRPTTLKKQ